MPITFNERVKVKPVDKPDEAAKRLEVLLDRYLPPTPPGDRSPHEDLGWRLKDRLDSRTTGDSPAEVFADFREHGLEPHSLFHDRPLRPSVDGSSGIKLEVFYPIYSKEIWLDVNGSDRTAVDGVAAACRRIQASLEKFADQSDQAVAAESVGSQGNQMNATAPAPTGDRQDAMAGPTPATSIPSSKQRWKDNLALFIITAAAGVATAAAVVWLNIG